MSVVLAEHRDDVLWVTINRPEMRNAVDLEVCDALRAELRDVQARAIVLQGAGTAFCSGGDLADKASLGLGTLNWMRRVGDLVLSIANAPVPTIAKVHGPAFGLGANLAFACDLTLASEGASFCEIFAQRGLSVDGGGTWLLPRLVGLKKAKELAMLCERIDAAQALELGLVNRVVPEGELDALVEDWATRLASGATQALGLIKSMMDDAFGISLEEALEREGQAQAISVASNDVAEGFKAFMEKRPANFVGS